MHVLDSTNDLWLYDIASSTWYWMGGSHPTNNAGIYSSSIGGVGTPGARYQPAHWMGADGQLWIFSGYGYDASSTEGRCTILEEYLFLCGD